MPVKKGKRSLRARIAAWCGSTRCYWGVTALLVVIGIAVRIYRFGDVPAGLHRDEASLAYDAYSLLTYGIERNGYRWPIIFGAYGSGQSGTLAGYFSIPFIWLLGLTPIASRAVNLVFGIASLFVFPALARRLEGKAIGLTVLFLLAINPWHIMISRWGLDCNLFPQLFLIAVYLMVRGLQGRSSLLPVSAVVLGLCLYSYGASYVFLPVFLTLTTLYLLWKRLLPVRQLCICLPILALLAAPIALYLWINYANWPSIVTPLFTIPSFENTPRHTAALALHQGGYLDSVAKNLGALTRLLISQNDGWLEDGIRDFGMLYLTSLPFALLGFFAMLSRKSKGSSPLSVLMVFWLIGAIAVGAVIDPIIHRMNIIVFPLLFFTALGFDRIRQWSVAAFASLIVLYVISFGVFTHTYFGTYADKVARLFLASLDEAVDDAMAAVPGTICVTDTNVIFPEMNIVYHLRMDPREFRKTVIFYHDTAMYRHTRSFGRFQIGMEGCDHDRVDAYILTPEDMSKINKADFTFRKYQFFIVAERLWLSSAP